MFGEYVDSVRPDSPYAGEIFVQARVDKDGAFTLPLVAPGNQIVIVCRGESVLFAKRIQWTMKTQFLRIDLQRNSIDLK